MLKKRKGYLSNFALGLFILGLSASLSSSSANPTQSNSELNLKNCQAAAQYSAKLKGSSMLVMQHGKIIFEDYPNGHNKDEAHELASGTKSFSGLMALAAMEDGLLNLDEKASATLSEWKEDPQREKITIRQLLNLVSGINSKSSGKPPNYAESLKAEITAPAGEKFQYGPAPFQIFGEIMRRKLSSKKDNVLDYITRRVLDPAGVHVAVWRKGTDGMPLLPQGAQLDARNWAKLGEFILQKGKAGQKQVIKEEDLQILFQGTPQNPMYGLTWWLNRPMEENLRAQIKVLTMASDLRYATPGVPNDLVMAAGAGKQRLYIVPSQDLVVVRQADGIIEAMLAADQTGFSDIAFWQILSSGHSGLESKAARAAATAEAGSQNSRRDRVMRIFDRDHNGRLDANEEAALKQFMLRRKGRISQ